MPLRTSASAALATVAMHYHCLTLFETLNDGVDQVDESLHRVRNPLVLDGEVNGLHFARLNVVEQTSYLQFLELRVSDQWHEHIGAVSGADAIQVLGQISIPIVSLLFLLSINRWLLLYVLDTRITAVPSRSHAHANAAHLIHVQIRVGNEVDFERIIVWIIH